MDDAAAIKETRRVLRRVQEHMTWAHRNLGATVDDLGLVEVLHHPTNPLPHLNYVAPRRNTAWIPGPEVEKGLNHLRELGRVARVYLIEGLYPPLFAKSLRDLDLHVEQEVAIMTCKLEQRSSGRQSVPLPDDTRIEVVKDQEGIALWWYVWRNARYDVVTNGVEPIYIGKEMREIVLGNQIDVILYKGNFPIGVARLTLNGDTANIAAVAVLKEARNPDTLRALYQTGLNTAADRGCTLVYTSGETEEERRICRKAGFVDAGSILCYAESSTHEASHDNHLEQPAFIL